jgi:predicted nucleotidyltransferase component of viral defense system
VYFGECRFSDDLDFTPLENADADGMVQEIREAVREARGRI